MRTRKEIEEEHEATVNDDRGDYERQLEVMLDIRDLLCKIVRPITLQEIENGNTKVIVNGKEFMIVGDLYAYEGFVRLAGLKGTPTITYRRAHNPRTDGELLAGESLWIAPGTIINVVHTNNA